MRKSRALTALILLLVLGLAAFSLRALWTAAIDRLDRELAAPRILGGVLLLSEGVQRHGLSLDIRLLTLSTRSWNLELRNCRLRFHWASFSGPGTLATLDVDSAGFLVWSGDSVERPPMDTTPLPVHLPRIPFGIRAQISELAVSVQDLGSWNAHTVKLRNLGPSGTSLRLSEIKGTFLEHTIDAISINAHWDAEEVFASVHGLAGPDSLQANAQAGTPDISHLKGTVRLVSPVPARWIPSALTIPDSVKIPTEIDASASIDLQARKRSAQWSAQLLGHTASLWQIPGGHLNLQANGDLSGKLSANAQLSFPSTGGSIQINAKRAANGIIDGNSRVDRVNLVLASRTMPADARITHFLWNGHSIQLDLTTRNGSHVAGLVRSLSPLQASFDASIAPHEPWAVHWTDTNLVLKGHTQIHGDFADGVLEASVRGAVEKAWIAWADSVQANLRLMGGGIRFDSGTIKAAEKLYRWNGEVHWGHDDPHLQFELLDSAGGNARMWMELEQVHSISVAASGLQIHGLPLRLPVPVTLEAKITGTWSHHFGDRHGVMRATIESAFRGQPLILEASAHQAGDTLSLDNARLRAAGQDFSGRAMALILIDPWTGHSQIQLQEAAAQTDSLDLPSALAPFRDSVVASGVLRGMGAFRRGQGLSGMMVLNNFTLSHVDHSVFSIDRARLEALGQRVTVEARMLSGSRNEWDGAVELIVDSILTQHKDIQAAYIPLNGNGAMLLRGIYADSSFDATARATGPWILPGGVGELASSDIRADIHLDMGSRKDHRVSVHVDSAQYLYGTLLSVAVSADANWKNGMIDIPTIHIVNPMGDTLRARAMVDTREASLRDLQFRADRFRLPLSVVHLLDLRNIVGNAALDTSAIRIDLQLPQSFYTMDDPSLGKARSTFHGNARLTLPRKSPGGLALQGPTLNGTVELDKLVYERNLGLGADWKNVQKGLGSITSLFGSLGRSRGHVRETKHAGGSRPMELNLRIHESGKDSTMIVSDVLQVPLTIDLVVSGPMSSPLINGDINSSGHGKLGIDGFAMFDLEQLRIAWADSPIRDGSIELHSTHDLPFCQETEDNKSETCPVSFELQGTLGNPVPLPSTDCGMESTPAATYYALWLGCVPASGQMEGTAYSEELNKWTGRIFGNILSRGINWGTGTDLVGDVGIRYSFWGENQDVTSDSNYIRIPVKLDYLAKDLSLILAYSQGTGTNPRFDQSTELGLRYKLPVFDSTDSRPDFLDPRAEATGSIQTRRYHSTDAAATDESRVEAGLGLGLSYQYWTYCILGMGACLEEEAP